MDLINFFNIALYITIGVLSYQLWKKGENVCAVALGSLALHGLLFNGVYIYRDILWETCPPQCGLQHWSSALRLHGLSAIVTSMMYRLLTVK